MKIIYKNIILRDMMLSDIEDDIRWKTVETQWQKWDEPWEYEVEEQFDEENYRKKALEEFRKLEQIRRKDEFRLSLEIDTLNGVHIGTIDTYCVDENYESIRRSEIEEGKVYFNAIGIAIYDSKYWGKGLGTEALEAYIDYFKEHNYNKVLIQTWSGNIRMMKVAKKLNFSECFRKKGSVVVKDKKYDEVSFCLNLRKEKY